MIAVFSGHQLSTLSTQLLSDIIRLFPTPWLEINHLRRFLSPFRTSHSEFRAQRCGKSITCVGSWQLVGLALRASRPLRFFVPFASVACAGTFCANFFRTHYTGIRGN